MRLSLFLFTFSTFAWAGTLPGNVRQCRGEVSALLTRWESAGDWRETASNGNRRFVSPTKTLGLWVAMEVSPHGDVVKVTRRTQLTQESSTFGADCQVTTKVAASKTKIPEFNDANLKKLAQQNGEFLIYVWRPDAAYATESLAEVEKLKKEMKLPIYTFLDKDAPMKQAEEIAAKTRMPASALKKIDSFDLNLRSEEKSFPVMYHVQKGRISTGGMHGYKTYTEYLQLLKKRRAHLEGP